MKAFKIEFDHNIQNAGIAREWGLCAYYGIDRTAHDSVSYDKGSDIETADKNISVKASGFTLMSGSLCEGLSDFDGIWNLYASRVHSDTFAYVTEDGTTYEMNLNEFKEMVYTFCKTEKESAKNGGATKIRCKKESAKMRAWLEARA